MMNALHWKTATKEAMLVMAGCLMTLSGCGRSPSANHNAAGTNEQDTDFAKVGPAVSGAYVRLESMMRRLDPSMPAGAHAEMRSENFLRATYAGLIVHYKFWETDTSTIVFRTEYSCGSSECAEYQEVYSISGNRRSPDLFLKLVPAAFHPHRDRKLFCLSPYSDTITLRLDTNGPGARRRPIGRLVWAQGKFQKPR